MCIRHYYRCGGLRFMLAAALMVSAPWSFAASPAAAPVPSDHAERMERGLELFRQHVGPALTKHCANCHSGKSAKADFDLSTREALLESGMVSTTAADSRMLALMRHEEEPYMPHQADKLPQLVIDQVAQWLDLGAPYDAPLGDSENAHTAEIGRSAADRSFWSFVPLSAPVPPTVQTVSWCRTPLDRFVLASLESRGLTPNTEADPRALTRRLYADVLGLPAPAEEVEALREAGPEGYDVVVDRLLNRPEFGEKWARHWLDIARFAESGGFEHDSDRLSAYHYRDFVIKALNDDLPFDDFVRWQLAGDEVAPDNPWALMATGFLTAGVLPSQVTEAEFERTRYDQLDDMVATTGVAFLGLTVGCARCHDHKYDPISSRDYYQLVANFTTTVPSEITATIGTGPASRTEKILVGTEGLPPVENHAAGRGYPYFYPQTHHLLRGDTNQKQEPASPGYLSVLTNVESSPSPWSIAAPDGSRTSHRRHALAEWLVDTKHGAGNLAARVLVNRIWQHYFGRGLVSTPNDFGMQGQRPTHPELLDWLASELIRSGWSMKHIHRLILTSQVYRQSSATDPTDSEQDPENRWYWRRSLQRLDAEILRDSMLASSGRIERRMYGLGTLDEAMRRRSVYFTIKRSQLISSMQLFDAPEPLSSIGERATTTTAPQALMFLNGSLVRQCAEDLASQLVRNSAGGLDPIIRAAYRSVLSREPTAEEMQAHVAEIQRDQADYEAAGHANAPTLALQNFCQLLVSLNEFMYLP